MNPVLYNNPDMFLNMCFKSAARKYIMFINANKFNDEQLQNVLDACIKLYNKWHDAYEDFDEDNLGDDNSMNEFEMFIESLKENPEQRIEIEND